MNLLRYLFYTIWVSNMVRAMTLRLPDELNKKLEKAIRKGSAITKAELIRRAIDEFIEKHTDMFS